MNKNNHIDKEILKTIENYLNNTEMTKEQFIKELENLLSNKIKIEFEFKINKSFLIPLTDAYYPNISTKKYEEKINYIFDIEQNNLDTTLDAIYDDEKAYIECKMTIYWNDDKYTRSFKYNTDTKKWEII